MCATMAGFSINDGLLKLTFDAFSIPQSLFLRGLVASSLVLLLAWRMGALNFWPTRAEWGPLSLRAIGEVGATAAFITALANMPIADATAVLQAAPLAVTMAAALFLGERVGWRRWSAIGVGFVGMLVIVRPGAASFDVFTLLAVVSVFFVVVRDLGTRLTSARTPTLFTSAFSAVLITVGSGLLTPLTGFAPVSAQEFGILALAGLFVGLAYIANVASMRIGEIAVVAPFRYTVLLWAIVVGFVFFGDLPDGWTLLGAAIVIAAGLYTLWRERVTRRNVGRAAGVRPYGTADR